MPAPGHSGLDALVPLARDRRNVTPELHPSNDFYGYASVLKAWAGLPARVPLLAAVEHGLPLQDEIWDADLRAPLPTFLCASAGRAAAYEATAAARRVAVPIGPPIAYAGRPGESLEQPAPADAPLLAFPSHSTHHIEARFDAEGFARTLLDLRKDWPAVRVCLYWRDVLEGAAELYHRHGFECVCAGHIFDAGFLPRLRALLTGSGGVVTNAIGTHVLYAVLCGRPAWITEHPVTYLERDAASVDRDFMTSNLTEQAAAVFAGPPRQAPTREQIELATRVGGLAYVRQPEELAQILADARARYRAGSGLRERATRRARARVRWAIDALRARLS